MISYTCIKQVFDFHILGCIGISCIDIFLFPVQVALFVGYPGSGKSFVASTHFAGLGYIQANRDTVGSWQKCVSVLEKALGVIICDTGKSYFSVRCLFNFHILSGKSYFLSDPYEIYTVFFAAEIIICDLGIYKMKFIILLVFHTVFVLVIFNYYFCGYFNIGNIHDTEKLPLPLLGQKKNERKMSYRCFSEFGIKISCI